MEFVTRDIFGRQVDRSGSDLLPHGCHALLVAEIYAFVRLATHRKSRHDLRAGVTLPPMALRSTVNRRY
jgi:hypothetical protein